MLINDKWAVWTLTSFAINTLKLAQKMLVMR